VREQRTARDIFNEQSPVTEIARYSKLDANGILANTSGNERATEKRREKFQEEASEKEKQSNAVASVQRAVRYTCRRAQSPLYCIVWARWCHLSAISGVTHPSRPSNYSSNPAALSPCVGYDERIPRSPLGKTRL